MVKQTAHHNIVMGCLVTNELCPKEKLPKS